MLSIFPVQQSSDKNFEIARWYSRRFRNQTAILTSLDNMIRFLCIIYGLIFLSSCLFQAFFKLSPSLFLLYFRYVMYAMSFILFIGIRDLIPGLIVLAFYGVEGRMFCILFSAMHTLMELLMNPMCIALLISQSLQ